MTIGISWMILCAKHWREILTVQHFISGVIFFLMVEMAFNWGYWDDYNKAGESCKYFCCSPCYSSGQWRISVFPGPTSNPTAEFLTMDMCSGRIVGPCLHPELWTQQFVTLHAVDCLHGLRCCKVSILDHSSKITITTFNHPMKPFCSYLLICI